MVNNSAIMNTVSYLLRQYWKNAEGKRGMAIIAMLMMIAGFGIWAFEPLLFGAIVNTVQHYSGAAAINKILLLNALWVGMYILFNAVFRTSMYLAHRLAYHIKTQYLTRNYRKLTRLSLKWHSDHHSGDTISRVGRAADVLHEMTTMQWRCFQETIAVVGSFAGLAYINWKVALLTILLSALFFKLLSFIDRALRKKQDEINEKQNRIMAALFDFVANMRSIITLRLGERTARGLDAKIEDARKPTVYAWGTLAQFKWISISMAFMFLQVGVLLYFTLSALSAGDAIDLGMLTATFLYLGKIGSANFEFTDIYNGLIKYKAALVNAEIVENADDMLPPERKMIKWNKLEIKGLRFSYGGSHGKNVLSNVDLTVRRGEKIALMGESGAGKSTLLTLLRGLVRADAGDMLIDGKRKSGGVDALSSITTLMLQDPEVFEHTIRYNITMGLDYSDADVKKALKISRFDVVLKKLPEGLETDIREKGVNLSGGERQRLALARNILAAKDSEIVLMDEITSSVDVENETLIYDAILREFKSKTVIAAVHKPAMAAKFRRIVRIV